MKIRQLFTWPGDYSLQFLIWRDDLCDKDFLHTTLYYVLFLPSLAAQTLMITADVIDEFADWIFPPKE